MPRRQQSRYQWEHRDDAFHEYRRMEVCGATLEVMEWEHGDMCRYSAHACAPGVDPDDADEDEGIWFHAGDYPLDPVFETWGDAQRWLSEKFRRMADELRSEAIAALDYGLKRR